MGKSEHKSWMPEGWELVEFIAEGGQGRTYKVRRKSSPTEAFFVFKRLKSARRADRFDAEIKALRALNHPGILQIEQNGTVENNPYYIAEFCQNGDLAKRNLKGATTIEKLLLFRQICSALADAHAAKIVHRDIKPANILIRSDGTTAVGDFGLCLHLDDSERHTLTEEVVGARNYMAPELEDGRRDDVTPAADVYSLGKLLYFLFSGRSFSREKHREPEYDLTRTTVGQVENANQFIYELLDRSIVENAQCRFQNAFELTSAVDRAIRKTILNAHTLDKKIRQPCMYCVDGDYRPISGGQANEYGITFVCWQCGNTQRFASPHNGWNAWWLK
jgi:serine/threonine protein kinase